MTESDWRRLPTMNAIFTSPSAKRHCYQLFSATKPLRCRHCAHGDGLIAHMEFAQAIAPRAWDMDLRAAVIAEWRLSSSSAQYCRQVHPSIGWAVGSTVMIAAI